MRDKENQTFRNIQGVFIVLLVVCLSGCVSTDLVQQMVRDIDDLKAENERMQAEISELESELSKFEEAMDSKSDSGIGSIADDGEDSGEMYTEMEGVLSGADEEAMEAVEERDRPSAVSAEELYTRAQGLYSDERYREAVQVYKQAKLLDDSPEFQARCEYWIGECMYAQGAYERALESFARIFVKYGDSAKAADALLKIGFTYYEMGNYNGARQALNEFIQRFPDHRAVPFAEDRLHRMNNLESGD